MPKRYEYFGLIVMFYANEPEPVHVHGQCQGREAKAELLILNGAVTEIRYSEVAGRAPLEFREKRGFGGVGHSDRRPKSPKMPHPWRALARKPARPLVSAGGLR